MFEEPAENKLLKLLKEGALREAVEEEGTSPATDNRLLRILREKRKRADESPKKSAEETRRLDERAAPPRTEAETRRLERADARRILDAARTEEPPPSMGGPHPAEPVAEVEPPRKNALRDMVRAAAEEAAPEPSAARPRAARPPRAEPAHAAVDNPPVGRPAEVEPPASPLPEIPAVEAQHAEVSAPRASVTPTRPPSPRRGPVDWQAPPGGLALTLLLKAEQIEFLVKMAEGGQSGSLVRLMLVAQALMGGQGEWGLAGLLQEYARAIIQALNKLMIQERMRKEVDLAKVKDADLDALLEEIRDLLEAEELSTMEASPVPTSGLLLGMKLPREDVAFLRKLASPRGEQTLVGHLLFTQSLMAHEVVPESPWPEGPDAARLREDFKSAVQNYRELQKTLLNQILVSARLGKKTAWGAPNAAKHEAALAALARGLKACLPGAQ